MPIVIRVFDVGGDKQLELTELSLKESNPVLGCRDSILTVRHKDIFKTQLRAICRCSCSRRCADLTSLNF